MSVTIMAAVFAANMPELKTDDGKTVPDSTAKFVLLALADHASEDGENAYIGVKRICQKTNLSTSTVCNALNALRTSNLITLVGKSKSETNNYTINVARVQSLKFQPLESSDSSHRNPEILATEVKPSFNHHNNHIANATSKIVESADKTVDAILEAERNAHEADKQGKAWRGRELVMDAYLPYGDWWHKKTGLHMYAAKAKPKANSSWIKEFQAWWENDLTTEVLELAFQTESAWRGVITHPRELTAKAIALSVNPNPAPAKNQPPVSNVKRSTTVQYEDDGTPINY